MMIGAMDASSTGRDLERAFLALHDREAGMILRYLHASVGDPQDAEDLAAETFERAWRQWPKFRQREGVPARNWLIRIAHNVAVDSHRSRARRPGAQLDASMASPEEGLSIDRVDLARAMGELSQKSRQLIALRASGLQFAEVGDALGMSEPAAKMAWRRAAIELRRHLGDQA